MLGEGRRCAVCREMTKARRVSSRSSSLSRFFRFRSFHAAPRRAARPAIERATSVNTPRRGLYPYQRNTTENFFEDANTPPKHEPWRTDGRTSRDGSRALARARFFFSFDASRSSPRDSGFSSLRLTPTPPPTSRRVASRPSSISLRCTRSSGGARSPARSRSSRRVSREGRSRSSSRRAAARAAVRLTTPLPIRPIRLVSRRPVVSLHPRFPFNVRDRSL